MAEVVGYARVSTDGQSVHDQIVQLKAAGATRVLSEKLSGARFDRAQLRKAIAALSKGRCLAGDPARPAGTLYPRSIGPLA